jgi:peroxiredoxin
MAYGAADSPKAGAPARVTYVIDASGVITHTLDTVDPATHTDDVLAMVT